MKAKLILLVFAGAGVVTFGVIRNASTVQQKSIPYKDRLKWYANEAKAQGRQKITVPAPVIEYLGGAGTITAEEAFATSTVVIAHLVSKKSYPRDEDIITWNKFAIDDVLAEAKELPCHGCGPSDPPSAILPLQSGEFVVPKTGGTVDIDGVEVKQIDDAFAEYEFNERYLLLITLFPNGTARTFGGPVGVFRIINNDRLVPARDSEHRIVRDLQENFGNSLDRLRNRLKLNVSK